MRCVHAALALFLIVTTACRPSAQSRAPLPPCEWCGAAEAPASLTATARLADPQEPGDRLVITGTVFRADGRTPAGGVLLYAYQTDTSGLYPMRGNETGNGRRHGALRGWLRTGTDGRYRIETIRPAPYPQRNTAAHIHITLTPRGDAVGENVEGWIDDIVFSDDPLLSARDRAGRGVVTLTRDARGVLQATRDIRLSEMQRAVSQPAAYEIDRARAYDIDLARSYVAWTGTKFRGRGKHEGIVRLRSGTLSPCTPGQCRGRFTLDMHNLEITDIPPSDPVPRRRLREHLRSRDFFWTERFPDATFVLHGTRPAAQTVQRDASPTRDRNSLIATGALTLRGVTRPLSFVAHIVADSDAATHVRAETVIDRQAWGVSYRFDPIRNEIVDDDIRLVIVLVARARTADELNVTLPNNSPHNPERS